MGTASLAAQTFTTTAGNKTTASFTPAAGDILVAFCQTTGIAAGTTAVSDTQSGSWTFLNPPGHVAQGSNTTRLGFWVRAGRVAASSMTVTATQASSTGGGLIIFRLAGVRRTGTGIVRSYGSQDTQTAGTTPAPVLNLTPLPTSIILIGLLCATATNCAVPRSGYTESIDTGYSSPTTGVEFQFLNSGETSATLTFGGTTASAYCDIGIEIDVAGPMLVQAPKAPAGDAGYGRPW